MSDKIITPEFRAAYVGLFKATAPKENPGRKAGRGKSIYPQSGLEPVEDLVGPEPFEPVQRFVERGEFVGIDAANLLNGAHVLLIEPLDDVTHLAALVGAVVALGDLQ